MAARGNRKQAILEALARELESHPGDRITTAALARAVGVSEAALYRHFPSKARMFEALILFAEESVFGLINQILESERQTRVRCFKVLYLLLGFADRNPGITRLLLGDALVGEREGLQARGQQFFQRLSTQLRQVLRESSLRNDTALNVSPEQAAELLVTYAAGRLQRFVHSRFTVAASATLEEDWSLLSRGLFGDQV